MFKQVASWMMSLSIPALAVGDWNETVESSSFLSLLFLLLVFGFLTLLNLPLMAELDASHKDWQSTVGWRTLNSLIIT